MKTEDKKMENIVALAKRRGFIFQGSEIYGGLAGTYDYGPLGVALKNNIKNLWWHMFVDTRDDVYGIDAAILMNEKVWEASGHTGAGFTDPVVECTKCHGRFRTDQLITDLGSYQSKRKEFEVVASDITKVLSTEIDSIKTLHDKAHDILSVLDNEQNKEIIDLYIDIVEKYANSAAEKIKKTKGPIELLIILEEEINKSPKFRGLIAKRYLNSFTNCPNCNARDWGTSKDFNLMFETKVGAQGDIKSYLRPETAQGIFVNFKNIIDTMRPKLPFGIAQIGKAFRNEINPRDFIFRTREFEQMEIEYFVEESAWEGEFEKLREAVWSWIDVLGLSRDNVREFDVPNDELAHYSKRTIDFEYNYAGKGFDELLGLAYRTDHDLQGHMKASGEKMVYTPPEGAPFVPHIIEPSFGVERALMAVLSEAYTEDEMNGETRVFLKLKQELAPVKVAVFPLMKNKPELVAKAREIYEELKKSIPQIMFDDNGNVGKRYRRQDEIGTPWCVTVDFDTLEGNDVTVRDRDTGEQKRIALTELVAVLQG